VVGGNIIKVVSISITFRLISEHSSWILLPILASAADKSDTQEGKGNAQEHPVIVQEFMSYVDHKSMEDYD
jgi:hypothetical protein